jgi:hypothetical protein
VATLIVVEELAGPAVIGRGGHAMRVLQTLHGLERLGHQAVFLEFLQKDPGPARNAVIRYFRETVSTWWRPDRSALVLEPGCETLWGLPPAEVERLSHEAAGLLTLMPVYRREPPPLVAAVRPRVLLEQDPAYTHLWAAGGDPAKIYGEHDYYFTVGRNIGTLRCAVPTLGIRWHGLWNPVALDWWSAETPFVRDRFTTLAEWRGYGYLEFEGHLLGPKAEQFRQFIDLPGRVGEALELALNIDPDDPDLATLRRHGWRIEDPGVARSPAQFRDYVAGSFGEFSCAKGGYAGTRCGWFSDRSACYLAAGRPVILQSTGFEDLLPTGKGLFAVATVEEAAEAVKRVRRDHALHSAAARDIAREHFDGQRIIQRLLTIAGIGGA